MNNSKSLVLFGMAVRQLRLAKGITQDALAARCGRYKKQIPEIENGGVEVTLDMVIVLSNALDVAPGVLLKEVTPPEPTKPTKPH